MAIFATAAAALGLGAVTTLGVAFRDKFGAIYDEFNKNSSHSGDGSGGLTRKFDLTGSVNDAGGLFTKDGFLSSMFNTYVDAVDATKSYAIKGIDLVDDITSIGKKGTTANGEEPSGFASIFNPNGWGLGGKAAAAVTGSTIIGGLWKLLKKDGGFTWPALLTLTTAMGFIFKDEIMGIGSNAYDKFKGDDSIHTDKSASIKAIQDPVAENLPGGDSLITTGKNVNSDWTAASSERSPVADGYHVAPSGSPALGDGIDEDGLEKEEPSVA